MKSVIYASDGYRKFFNRSVEKVHFLDELNVHSLSDCTIVIDPDHKFGVFDSAGMFVPSSGQKRNKVIQTPPVFMTANDYLDVEAVYLGTLEDHFGHFLLEHTTRLYALLRQRYQGKKYILVNNRNLPGVSDFVYQLFALLGIDRNDVIVVSSSVGVRKLYVPEVAFEIPNTSSKAFGKIFDAAASAITSDIRHDKVYVSRLKLGDRATYGEEQIQQIFASNGFAVIYPECLSFDEQVAYMRHCKCLAGIAGSALHLSLFMPSGGTVVQIKRNKPYRDNSDTQYLLCATKGCDFVLVDCALERLPTHHWSEFPQIVGPTKFLHRFCLDNCFVMSATDMIPGKKYRKAYRAAFRSKGGFLRYQLKRMLVYSLPRLIPFSKTSIAVKRWLNKHI